VSKRSQTLATLPKFKSAAVDTQIVRRDHDNEMPDLYAFQASGAQESRPSQGAADRKIAECISHGVKDKCLTLSGMSGLTPAGIMALAKIKSLHYLDLTGTRLTDEDVKVLSSLKLLRLILDENLQISDLSLKYLASMSTLNALSLARTSVTDDGLKALDSLPVLYTLVLDDNRQLTDNAIKNLKPSTSPLESIFASGTGITDASASELLKFSKLRIVGLSHVRGVSDHLVEALREKKENIEWMLLAGDNITDSGVQALTAYKKLERLDLSENKISGNSISSLYRLKQLQHLYLPNYDLSTDYIQRLRKELPKTKISTKGELSPQLMPNKGE
jgi:internalin A